jgi:NAD(P)H-hydrate epimerase
MDTLFWLSRDEVRELDRRASEEFGVPSIVLMENAGRGAAELLMRLNPERKPVTILCGPGNNGGDGFVMARHLDNHGWPVHTWLFLKSDNRSWAVHVWLSLKANQRVEAVTDVLPEEVGDALMISAELSNDARVNFHVAHRSGISIQVLKGPPSPWQLDMLRNDLIAESGYILDALFGTGLRGEVGPPFNDVIAAINQSGKPVLAVDIPSGLDCDSGKPMLGQTVKATQTATFVGWKKGFLQPSAKPWIGEVHVIDIGAPKKLVDEYRALRQAAEQSSRSAS